MLGGARSRPHSETVVLFLFPAAGEQREREEGGSESGADCGAEAAGSARVGLIAEFGVEAEAHAGELRILVRSFCRGGIKTVLFVC